MAKKTEQAPITENQSWEEIVAKAKDLPEILPKLRFGKAKLDEVRIDVEFLEDQPRFITFKDPFNDGKDGKALVVNVRVLAAEGPGNVEQAGNSRCLILKNDANHGLTRGIIAAAKRHGSRLKGRAVRIETTVYKHATFGDTRGYTVSEISPPTEQAP